jgi:hypothetical protein
VLRLPKTDIEVDQRSDVTPYGGLALFSALARRFRFAERIDSSVHLFKLHLPFHESDHILAIAANLFVGGTCIEDQANLQQSEAVRRLLGAVRIPDPTTAGDFLRRFDQARAPGALAALRRAHDEIARDVGDGFAFTEAGLRVIEENDVAAHALNADFEGDAGAKGGLFKNQREKFAAQGVRVICGIRLDVSGDREEFAGVRGAPFGSGEEIVRDEDWRCQSRGCHFVFLPYCGVSRVPRRFRRSDGFRNMTQNLFEDREKFADLLCIDDESGQQP